MRVTQRLIVNLEGMSFSRISLRLTFPRGIASEVEYILSLDNCGQVKVISILKRLNYLI